MANTFQGSFSAYQLPSVEYIRAHKDRWTVVGGDKDTVALRLKHELGTPQQEIKFVVAATRVLLRPAVYSTITLKQENHDLTVRGRVIASFFIRNQPVGTIIVEQE